MNMLSFLSMMACFAYFILGLYIYLYNRHEKLNRAFFLLSLIFTVYAFAYAFYYVAPDKQSAIRWYKISSIGWTLFPVFLLNFVLILTKNQSLRKNWLFYPLMFLPGFIFLYLAMDSHFYARDFVFTGYYWAIVPNLQSATFWIYLAYMLTYAFISFGLLINWRKNTRLNKEKKQSFVILLAFSVTFILAVATNILSPMLKKPAVPDIAHISSLVMVAGIAYAIRRYRLMMVTPGTAAGLMMAHMHEYLFFTDNDGQIIRCNDFTIKQTGYDRNELCSKYFIELTDEKIINLEKLNAGKQHEEERIRLTLNVRKNKKIPLSMICTPVFDDFNDRIGFVIVGYDTTNEDQLSYEIEERKNIEYELIKAKEKAEESDKLKSSFLANVSHELRTPLNGILGFTEILKMELDDTSLNEIVDYINQSGNRLLGTLNSLIDLSLIETDKNEIDKRLINVSELVQQKADLYKNYASSKNLYLETDISDNRLFSRTDPRLLGHVLNNLIDNAIKYTEEGGVVASLKQEKVGQRNYLTILIRDTGIGIAPEHFSKIFESFSQISEGFDRDYEGIGIGLSICKKFITLLDGEIWVESRLNEGSSFFVRLPAYTGTQQASPEKDSESTGEVKEKLPGQKPYILIVEDEKTNREYMKYTLSEHFEVDISVNGYKAYELAKKNRYDLIFMDVTLDKEMSGIHAMEEIRKLENYTHVPIAAVTANVMKTQQDEFFRRGFTHFLPKPFKRQQLLDLASEMMTKD